MALITLNKPGRYGGSFVINTDDISSMYMDRGFSYCDYILSMKNGDKHVIDHESYNKIRNLVE